MSDDKPENRWTLAPPLRLEDVRPCDLVICHNCGGVRYVGNLDLESRSPGLFEQSVKGVWCPGCDQLLFDEASWIEHRLEQREYDREVERGKEERAPRSGPRVGAALPRAADAVGDRVESVEEEVLA